ncbi:MAG: sigma-70 family RNA polymerase sigma factor [Crocinitomicaceae bacterium]
MVDRLKKREEAAMGEVYDRFASAMYGVASKIVRSDEVAQDVVQDSFVKIWKKVESYDSTKGTFFTWMLNITRNTAIDFLRKTKKENPASIQDLENSVHVSDVAAQNIDTIGIAALVDNLNEDQRILIEYIYFKGFTQQEVSDELGIPLGTVKTRIRAAVQELKKWFILFLLIWI